MQTWPEDWADQRRGIGCPFSAEGRPDENSDGVRIYSGLCADAYLSRHDAQPGYTAVVWRGRHVTEPTELTEEEAACYWAELLTVVRALELHFQPAKTNYQILGNTDDPAPGRPLPWPEGPRPSVPIDRFKAELAALRAIDAMPL